MSLRNKFFVLYLVIGLLVLTVMGMWMSAEFKKTQLQVIQNSVINQLKLLDFTLNNFLSEVKNDIQNLAINELVRTREDGDFTSFLNADEKTFQYNIGPFEQSIINVLNNFRITHPYVNSVYMGRENGSFVRSHPRISLTQYDPRDRPWYILARENPGRVMMTEPYSSVTTADVNLGIVIALQDSSKNVYGVIGTDITLKNLTDFISDFNIGHSGQLILVDEHGSILAHKDQNLIFTKIQDQLKEKSSELDQANQGLINFGNSYYYYYHSPALNWELVAQIPIAVIDQEVLSVTMYPALVSLILTILLFSLFTYLGLHYYVTKPIHKLSQFAQDISSSGIKDQKVDIKSRDELGKLANTFNQMIVKRKQIETSLQKERDLAKELGNAIATLKSTLEFEQVLDLILEGFSRIIPNDSANIMLVEGSEARITRLRGYERIGVKTGQQHGTYKIENFHTLSNMFNNRKSIIIANTGSSPNWVQVFSHEAIKSYAGTPIIIRDGVIGFINLGSTRKNFYNKTDLEPLNAFASHAAVAIDNARLHQQVKKNAAELQQRVDEATKEIRERANSAETLYRIAKEITSTLDLEDILQIIADKAAEIVNAEKSLIFLVNEKEKKVENAIGHGIDQEESRNYHFADFLEGVRGMVFKEKMAALVEDAQKDARFKGPALKRVIKENIHSMIIAPLIIADESIGTICVKNKKTGKPFNTHDMELIVSLAGQASLAIQNARLYELAQQADRIKSTFLSSMSHELRTPLNSIIGFTGILLQGLVGELNEEQTKQMRMVQGSASHLLELINDILDISKIEAGQLNINLSKFDFHDVIEKVRQTMTSMAEKKGLKLVIDVKPGVGDITSDRLRVEQVLINLVNNSIKFTEKGEIQVACQVRDRFLETRVTDTGIGIKKENIQKLFKPFQQVDSGLTRQFEGTGLGLSICKRLVEKLGGRIWVKSKYGSGSTFFFTLPMDEQGIKHENQSTYH